METVHFATTNKEKLLIAETVCMEFGIAVKQAIIDINEIQGEDPLVIVIDKAQRAYETLNKPVVVSDDSWDIPALNGFPGPYMKSINQWLTSEDFLRLMYGIKNRTIILHQFLCYNDGQKMQIFSNDINGHVIEQARGNNIQSPNMTVIVLDDDNGKTIAEVFEQGQAAIVDRYKSRPDAWHGFVQWYIDQAGK